MLKRTLYILFLSFTIALGLAGFSGIAIANEEHDHHDDHEHHHHGLGHHWEEEDYRKEIDWQLKGLAAAVLAAGGWAVWSRKMQGRNP